MRPIKHFEILRTLLAMVLMASPVAALAHTVSAPRPHTLSVHDHSTPAHNHSIAAHRRS